MRNSPKKHKHLLRRQFGILVKWIKNGAEFVPFVGIPNRYTQSCNGDTLTGRMVQVINHRCQNWNNARVTTITPFAATDAYIYIFHRKTADTPGLDCVCGFLACPICTRTQKMSTKQIQCRDWLQSAKVHIKLYDTTFYVVFVVISRFECRADNNAIANGKNVHANIEIGNERTRHLLMGASRWQCRCATPKITQISDKLFWWCLYQKVNYLRKRMRVCARDEKKIQQPFSK